MSVYNNKPTRYILNIILDVLETNRNTLSSDDIIFYGNLVPEIKNTEREALRLQENTIYYSHTIEEKLRLLNKLRKLNNKEDEDLLNCKITYDDYYKKRTEIIKKIETHNHTIEAWKEIIKGKLDTL